MKVKFKLFLIITIIGLLTIPNTLSVSGFDDIDYTFERDLLFESDDLSVSESFNMKNGTIYNNGTFPATESFTNETDFTESTNITFVDLDSSGVDTIAQINPEKGLSSFSHLKILQLFDNSAVNQANITNFFGITRESGTIEFWYRSSDVSKISSVRLRQSGVEKILIRFSGGKFQTLLDPQGWVDVATVESDKWYHIRIDFECGVGGYLGLGSDTYWLRINGTKEGFEFLTVATFIGGVSFTTRPLDTGYSVFIDAVGYSWDSNYEIGDNLFPFLKTNHFEVNRYEYALESAGVLRTIGSSSYGTWFESDSGGNDNVNIQADSTDDNNRVVRISTNNIGDSKGLHKDNFTLTSEYIRITIGFEFIDFGIGTTSHHIIAIESSDSTFISTFIMWHNGSLGYLDDISSTGIPIRDDLTTGEFYEMDIILDYGLDIFTLHWIVDSEVIDSYLFPLMANGKSGLKDIFIRSRWIDNLATMEVYYVGVYQEGISESKELGWSGVSVGIDNWFSEIHNLFFIVANGFFQFGMSSTPYDIDLGVPFTDDLDMLSQHFENTTSVFNSLNISDISFDLPQAIFFITGSEFNVSSISIEGVKLVEGVNEYILEFESSGVDISESYFFVDSNNRLQFSHIADDDGVLEFIQAEFNINDISSTDSIVSFTSRIDNNAFGFLRMNYNDTSQLIPIENIQKSKRVILTEGLTLDSFIILVSDTNKDIVSGLTTGFVSSISILDVENRIVSVSTLNLIEAIIPLILIIIPTLIIANYDKRFVVPMFVLMSTILAITSIIPIWLYFIIGITNAMFIFFEKERDDV